MQCLQLAHAPIDASTSDNTRTPRSPSAEGRAERELADYFRSSREDGTRNHEHANVESRLQSISAYHRGVLRLYNDARTWPVLVEEAFGHYAAIAIRLDCAAHPTAGSTCTLELLAAERMAAQITSDGDMSPRLFNLYCRAVQHYSDAIGAYAKARCELP